MRRHICKLHVTRASKSQKKKKATGPLVCCLVSGHAGKRLIFGKTLAWLLPFSHRPILKGLCYITLDLRDDVLCDGEQPEFNY